LREYNVRCYPLYAPLPIAVSIRFTASEIQYCFFQNPCNPNRNGKGLRFHANRTSSFSECLAKYAALLLFQASQTADCLLSHNMKNSRSVLSALGRLFFVSSLTAVV
jgi:hypothetical protein